MGNIRASQPLTSWYRKFDDTPIKLPVFGIHTPHIPHIYVSIKVCAFMRVNWRIHACGITHSVSDAIGARELYLDTICAKGGGGGGRWTYVYIHTYISIYTYMYIHIEGYRHNEIVRAGGCVWCVRVCVMCAYIVNVCIYVYTYKYIHLYRGCVCMYIYICICIYIYLLTPLERVIPNATHGKIVTRIITYIVYVYPCMFIYMYILICIYIHMYTNRDIYMYVYIYMYICIFRPIPLEQGFSKHHTWHDSPHWKCVYIYTHM